MSQAADLYAEKLAAAGHELRAAKERLSGSSPADRPVVERDIAILDAMMPLLERAVHFMQKVSDDADGEM